MSQKTRELKRSETAERGCERTRDILINGGGVSKGFIRSIAQKNYALLTSKAESLGLASAEVKKYRKLKDSVAAEYAYDPYLGGKVDRCLDFFHFIHENILEICPSIRRLDQSILLLAYQVITVMQYSLVSNQDLIKDALVDFLSKPNRRVRGDVYLQRQGNRYFVAADRPSEKISTGPIVQEIMQAIKTQWRTEELRQVLDGAMFEAAFSSLLKHYPGAKGNSAQRLSVFREGVEALQIAFLPAPIRRIYNGEIGYIPLSDDAERVRRSSEHIRPYADSSDAADKADYVSDFAPLSGSAGNSLFVKNIRSCLRDANETRGTAVARRKVLLEKLEGLTGEYREELTPNQEAVLRLALHFAANGTPQTARNEKIGSISRIDTYLHEAIKFFIKSDDTNDFFDLEIEDQGVLVEDYLAAQARSAAAASSSPQSLRVVFRVLCDIDLLEDFPASPTLLETLLPAPGGAALIKPEDFDSILVILSDYRDRIDFHAGSVAVSLVSLGRRYGARFSEAFNLKDDQLYTVAGKFDVEIRTRRGDRLKTCQSNGIVPGIFQLSQVEIDAFTYLKTKAANHRDAGTYLHRPISRLDAYKAENQIRGIIRRAICHATGRSDVRFHTLRHCFATDVFTALFIPDLSHWFSNSSGAAPDLPTSLLDDNKNAWNRFQALSRLMRHSSETVTIRYYVHNVHNLHYEYRRRIPWDPLPFNAVSILLNGRFPNSHEWQRRLKRKLPPEYRDVAKKGQAYRNTFPDPSSAAKQGSPFSLKQAMRIAIGEALDGAPANYPWYGVDDGQIFLLFQRGLELADITAFDRGEPAAETSIEELLLGQRPLIRHREVRRLLKIVENSDVDVLLSELAKAIRFAEVYRGKSRSRRWFFDDSHSAVQFARLLACLGFSERDVCLNLSDVSRNGVAFRSFDFAINEVYENRLVRYGLNAKSGVLIELKNGRAGSGCTNNDVTVMMFVAAVWCDVCRSCV